MTLLFWHRDKRTTIRCSHLAFLFLGLSYLSSLRAQDLTFAQAPYDSSLGGLALRNVVAPSPSYQGVAQIFQSASSGQLSSISVYTKGLSTPGTATLDLYSVTTSIDTNWTAANLIATVTGVSFTTANTLVVVNLASPVLISQDNFYAFTLRPETTINLGIGLNGNSYFETFYFTGSNYSGLLGVSSRDIAFTASGVAVPEPSTWAAMSGLAALALAWFRRRHRA